MLVSAAEKLLCLHVIAGMPRYLTMLLEQRSVDNGNHEVGLETIFASYTLVLEFIYLDNKKMDSQS